jgi:phosphatidylserine decarboxylase
MGIVFSAFSDFLKFSWQTYCQMFQLMLTLLAHFFSHSKNKWLKNKIILVFLTHFSPNLSEAIQKDPFMYESFNDFFTRKLASGARPIDDRPNSFVSPADGQLTQIGLIEKGDLIQAKNKKYSTSQLLGSKQLGDIFLQGFYSTIYLAPYDYHCVHMPLDGVLTTMIHIPGRLDSVSIKTAAKQDELYAKNERVVTIFKTEFGLMAVVLVGATLVGSIETVWHGLIRPKGFFGKVNTVKYKDNEVVLKKGELVGWFHYGSTVITLINNNEKSIKNFTTDTLVKVGQKLAQLDVL